MTTLDYRARFWRTIVPSLILFWCAAIAIALHLMAGHARVEHWERSVATHVEHRGHAHREGDQSISARA